MEWECKPISTPSVPPVAHFTTVLLPPSLFPHVDRRDDADDSHPLTTTTTAIRFLQFGGTASTATSSTPSPTTTTNALYLIDAPSASATATGRKVEPEGQAPDARCEHRWCLISGGGGGGDGRSNSEQCEDDGRMGACHDSAAAVMMDVEQQQQQQQVDHHHGNKKNEISLVMFGGRSGDRFFSDTWVLHVAAGKGSGTLQVRWERAECANAPPSARAGHSMVSVVCAGQRKVIVFGGYDGERSFGDVHQLDVESMIWEQVDIGGLEKPSPRFGHAANLVNVAPFHQAGVAQSMNRMVVTFGKDIVRRKKMINLFNPFSSSSSPTFFDDIWILDIEQKKWEQLKLGNFGVTGHAFHSSSYIGRGCVLLYGGESSSSSSMDSIALVIDIIAKKGAKIPYLQSMKATWPVNRKGQCSMYHTQLKTLIITGGTQSVEQKDTENFKDVCSLLCEQVFRVCNIGSNPISHSIISDSSSYQFTKPGQYKSREHNLTKIDKYTKILSTTGMNNIAYLRKRCEAYMVLRNYQKVLEDSKILFSMDSKNSDEHMYKIVYSYFRLDKADEAIAEWEKLKSYIMTAANKERNQFYLKSLPVMARLYIILNKNRKALDMCNTLLGITKWNVSDTKPTKHTDDILVPNISSLKAKITCLCYLQKFDESGQLLEKLSKYIEQQLSVASTIEISAFIKRVANEAHHITTVTTTQYLKYQKSKLQALANDTKNFKNIVTTALSYVEIGKGFEQKSDLLQAIAVYKKAVAMYPKGEQPLLFLIQAQLKSRDFISAIKNGLHLLEVNEECMDAYDLLANAYDAVRNSDKSIEILTKGIAISKAQNLSVITKQLENKLEQIMEKKEKLIQAFKRAGIAKKLLASEKWNEAIQELTLAIELDNENPEFFVMRAEAYLKLKQIAAGIEDCDKALTFAPEYIPAYLVKYQIFLTAQHLTRAQRILEKGLQKDIQNAQLIKELYSIKETIKKKTKAKVILLTAVNMMNAKSGIFPEPENLEIFVLHPTELHSNEAKLAKSILSKLNESAELCPKNKNILLQRARCLYVLREFRQSLTDIRSLLNVHKDDQIISDSEKDHKELTKKKKEDILRNIFEGIIIGAKAISSLGLFDDAIALLEREYPKREIDKAIQGIHMEKLVQLKQMITLQLMPITLNYRGYMKQGSLLKVQKKYKEALEQVQRAINVFPAKTIGNVYLATAFFEGAELHFLLGQNKDAEVWIEKALEQVDIFPHFYTLKICILAKRRAFKEAANVNEHALSFVSPFNTPLNVTWLRLQTYLRSMEAKQALDSAKRLIASGMMEEALPISRLAVRLSPLFLPAHLSSAIALYAQKYPSRCINECLFILSQIKRLKQSESEKDKKQITAMAELEIEAMRYKALAHLCLRQLNEGQRLLLEASHKYKTIFRRENTEITKDLMKCQALEKVITQSLSYALRAKDALKKGKYEKAIKQYSLAIDIDSGNPITLAARADLYYDQNDLTSAIADCDAALKLDKANELALRVKVESLIDIQKYKEAHKVVVSALSIIGSSDPLSKLLSTIEKHEKLSIETDKQFANAKELLASGEIDAGGQLLREIRSKSPFNVNYLISYIEYLLHEKNISEARSKIFSLIQLQPDNVDSHALSAKFYTEYMINPYEALLNIVEGLSLNCHHASLQDQLVNLLKQQINEITEQEQSNLLKTVSFDDELDKPFIKKYAGPQITKIQDTNKNNPPDQQDLSDILSDEDMKLLDSIEKPDDESIEEETQEKPTSQPIAKRKQEDDINAVQLLGEAFSFVKGLFTLLSDSYKTMCSEAYAYIIKAHSMLSRSLDEKKLQLLFGPSPDTIQKMSTSWQEKNLLNYRRKNISQHLLQIQNDMHPFYPKSSFQSESSYKMWVAQQEQRINSLSSLWKIIPMTSIAKAKRKRFHEDMIEFVVSIFVERSAAPKHTLSAEHLDIIYTTGEAHGFERCYLDLVIFNKYAHFTANKVAHGPVNAYKSVCSFLINLFERKRTLKANNNEVDKDALLFITSSEYALFERGYKLLQPAIESSLSKQYRCMTTESIDELVQMIIKLGAVCHLVRMLSRKVPYKSYSSIILRAIETNQQNVVTLLKGALMKARGNEDAGYLPMLITLLPAYVEDYDVYFTKILPRIDYMQSAANKIFNIVFKELVYHGAYGYQLMLKLASTKKALPVPLEILDLHEPVQKLEDTLQAYLQEGMDTLLHSVDRVVLAYLNIFIHNEEQKLLEWSGRAIALDNWKEQKHPEYPDRKFTTSIVDLFDALQAGLQTVQVHSAFLVRTTGTIEEQEKQEKNEQVPLPQQDQQQQVDDEPEELMADMFTNLPGKEQDNEEDDIVILQAQSKSNLTLIYFSFTMVIQNVIHNYFNSLFAQFKINLANYAKNNEDSNAFVRLTLIIGNFVVAMDQIEEMIKELSESKDDMVREIISRMKINLNDTIVILRNQFLIPMISEIVQNLFFSRIATSISTILGTNDTNLQQVEVSKIFNLLDKYLAPFVDRLPNQEVFIPLLTDLFSLIVNLIIEKVIVPLNKPKIDTNVIQFLNKEVVGELESYFFAGGQGIPKEQIAYDIGFLTRLFDIATKPSSDLLQQFNQLRTNSSGAQEQQIWNSPEERAILLNYILHFLNHNGIQEKDQIALQAYQTESTIFEREMKQGEQKVQEMVSRIDKAQQAHNEIFGECIKLEEQVQFMRNDYRITTSFHQIFMQRATLRSASKRWDIKTRELQSRQKDLEHELQVETEFFQKELHHLAALRSSPDEKTRSIARMAAKKKKRLLSWQSNNDDLETMEEAMLLTSSAPSNNNIATGFMISPSVRDKFQLSEQELLWKMSSCMNITKKIPGTLFLFTSGIGFEAQKPKHFAQFIPFTRILKLSKMCKTFEDDSLVITDSQQTQIYSGIKDRDRFFTHICNSVKDRTVELQREGQVALFKGTTTLAQSSSTSKTQHSTPSLKLFTKLRVPSLRF